MGRRTARCTRGAAARRRDPSLYGEMNYFSYSLCQRTRCSQWNSLAASLANSLVNLKSAGGFRIRCAKFAFAKSHSLAKAGTPPKQQAILMP